MCGRYVRTSSREVLAREFGITRFVNVDCQPRYNIAPSQSVEAIIRDGDELRLGPMRWGFVGASSRSSTPAPINARAETIATTALFRDAFRRRRCLVVADGFYEWQQNGKTKTPHCIQLRSGRPFSFAGIWSFQHAPEGTRFATCAIVTCAPNALMAPIHNRMPVILPEGAREQWLDPDAETTALRALLAPLPSDEMEAFAVSNLVNSPRNDGPECVQPRELEYRQERP